MIRASLGERRGAETGIRVPSVSHLKAIRKETVERFVLSAIVVGEGNEEEGEVHWKEVNA